MIGPCVIIAKRFRAKSPQKYRASIFNFIQIIACVFNKQFEMLRSDFVGNFNGLIQIISNDNLAVIVNGRVAKEGDFSLAKRISKEGYSFLEKEDGIKLEKEEKAPNQVSIGACAVKQVRKPEGK